MKTLSEYNSDIHRKREDQRFGLEQERHAFVERATEHARANDIAATDRIIEGRNRYIRDNGQKKPEPAGVACDCCGFEMLRSSMFDLAGPAGERRAQCLACGYCGVMAVER